MEPSGGPVRTSQSFSSHLSKIESSLREKNLHPGEEILSFNG